MKWLAWGLTVFAGLTMVSNVKFYSGKDINLRQSVPFSVVVGITFGLVALFMLSSTLPEMLFLLFVGYGALGLRDLGLRAGPKARRSARRRRPPPGRLSCRSCRGLKKPYIFHAMVSLDADPRSVLLLASLLLAGLLLRR